MIKRTILAAPGYGKQTAAAGRAIWRARRDMSDVTVEHLSSSLLAANFNGLWAYALNQSLDGPVDYFAMLHDDVGAEDFWLDALIDEMERFDFDVLGVAVPIKDRRGLTSLALDSGDNWRPEQRITIKELWSLPETFTSDDVGAPLLINTGCWVCRFNPEWASKVHFEVNDRIVMTPEGKYHAQCEPEDWFFSRLCHELGLKIGATRKVRCAHRGEVDFRNDTIWGMGYDSEHGSKSIVADQFPYDVPGWLHPDEGRKLAELSAGKDVLEIGSYCGKSTVCIGRTARSVTCVDFFDGRGTAVPGNTWGMFSRVLDQYGIAGKVTTAEPGTKFDAQFDLVFIDASHEADAVREDTATAIMALRDGGLIAFHDYQSPADPGVTEAVDELVAAGGEILSTHTTLAVVRPPVSVSV